MFKYYNANPLGRHVNDCTIRAISLATERPWDEVYRTLAEYAREEGITFSEVEFINDYLADRYERVCTENKPRTIREFMDMGLKGRYLITTRGHITCVIDGVLYDTFDCSDNFIWCAYRVK